MPSHERNSLPSLTNRTECVKGGSHADCEEPVEKLEFSGEIMCLPQSNALSYLLYLVWWGFLFCSFPGGVCVAMELKEANPKPFQAGVLWVFGCSKQLAF